MGGGASSPSTGLEHEVAVTDGVAVCGQVAHQYTLVDEQGPAHKKTFYVKLKLGEEEYSAQGESIKKAQHAAAAVALQETKFSHPVPKPPRYVEGEGAFFFHVWCAV